MNKVSLQTALRMLGLSYNHQWKDWLMLSCPFAEWTHVSGKDSNPSFGVHVSEEGISGYFCFTCKKKGRMSGMARTLGYFKNENLDNLALRIDLLEDFSDLPAFDEGNIIGSEQAQPVNEAIFVNMFPMVEDVEEARNYLKSRGISRRTARELRLVFDPDELRILFPVRNREGELYGYSGRTILRPQEYLSERYGKVKDYAGLKKHTMLLGMERKGKKPIALVEGLFAYAHLIEIGADKILQTLATLGSSLHNQQADILNELGKAVYIFYDNDLAGDVGLYGSQSHTGEHEGVGAIDKLKSELPVFIPYYPESVSDPDNLSYDQVKQMVKEAEFCS